MTDHSASGDNPGGGFDPFVFLTEPGSDPDLLGESCGGLPLFQPTGDGAGWDNSSDVQEDFVEQAVAVSVDYLQARIKFLEAQLEFERAEVVNLKDTICYLQIENPQAASAERLLARQMKMEEGSKKNVHEIGQLKESIKDKNIQLRELQGKNAQLRESIKGKNIQLREFEGKNAQLETSIDEKNIQLRELQGKNSQLETSIEEKNTQLRKFQGKNSQLIASSAAINTQLREFQGKNAELKRKVQEVDLKLWEAQKHAKGMCSQLYEKDALIQRVDGVDVSRTMQELQETRTELVRARNALEPQIRCVQNAASRNQRLRRDIDTLLQQNKKLTDFIASQGLTVPDEVRGSVITPEQAMMMERRKECNRVDIADDGAEKRQKVADP